MLPYHSYSISYTCIISYLIPLSLQSRWCWASIVHWHKTWLMTACSLWAPVHAMFCVAEAKSKATIIGPGSTPLFWKLCAWKSSHILETYLQVLHFSCIIAETPGPFSYWVTRSDQPTTTMADVRLCSLCLTIFILNSIKSTHIGRWTSVYLLTSPASFLCFRVSFTWESLCLSGHIKVLSEDWLLSAQYWGEDTFTRFKCDLKLLVSQSSMILHFHELRRI